MNIYSVANSHCNSHLLLCDLLNILLFFCKQKKDSLFSSPFFYLQKKKLFVAILFFFSQTKNVFFCFCCRNALQGPCMIWMDNFSKTLARQCPSLAKGVYSSCLWTGVAVFSDPQLDGMDVTVRRDAQGRVVPAMPGNLIQQQQQVMEGLQFVHSGGRGYLTHSLVQQFGVNTIPLKILDPADTPCQHSHHSHSMNIVHPMELIDKNIGSNVGLVSILKEDIHDKHGMGDDDCKNYVNLNVDENIFWRILKVCVLTFCYTCSRACFTLPSPFFRLCTTNLTEPPS